MTNPKWKKASLLVGFVLAALFLFLGTRGLNEPDEGRYAEIAREMVASGEWMVPHLNGFEHFQKPPLLYWFTAASIRILGVNEWGARLPSALAALGTVLLTYAIARRIAGQVAAVAAALVLVSSIEFFALARLLTPDMLLTFWVTAAIAALVFRKPWLFFICMGLGFLTKGPLALVVPISAAIAWQWGETAEQEKRALPWVRGLALTLAIGLSWFVALSLRDRALFEYFWRYELLERFASSARGRAKPFWFFVPVLLIGLLPWTLFLPARLRQIWPALRNGQLSAVDRLLLGWIVPPFLVLSVSGSKLPTYLLPLFPALAIFIAASVRVQALQWRIAIPATCCWLAAAAMAPFFNEHLDRQASLRPLAEIVRKQPDFATADIFTCELRAHGFEFYLSTLASMTKPQADLVLPMQTEQQQRLFESPEDLAKAYVNRYPCYGIVRPERFHRTFAAQRWSVLGKSGDFLLIASRSRGESELDVTSTQSPSHVPSISGFGFK